MQRARRAEFSFTCDDDDEQHRLRPPAEPAPIVFKALPKAIIQSIEDDRRRRGLPHSQSASDFLDVHRSSIDTTDDDVPDNDETTTTTDSSFQHRRNRSLFVTRTKRSPSELRVNLYADRPNDDNDSQSKVSRLTYDNEMHGSDPSLLDSKTSKQRRMIYVSDALCSPIGSPVASIRRFSSSTTLRSLNPHRFHPESLATVHSSATCALYLARRNGTSSGDIYRTSP